MQCVWIHVTVLRGATGVNGSTALPNEKFIRKDDCNLVEVWTRTVEQIFVTAKETNIHLKPKTTCVHSWLFSTVCFKNRTSACKIFPQPIATKREERGEMDSYLVIAVWKITHSKGWLQLATSLWLFFNFCNIHPVVPLRVALPQAASTPGGFRSLLIPLQVHCAPRASPECPAAI